MKQKTICNGRDCSHNSHAVNFLMRPRRRSGPIPIDPSKPFDLAFPVTPTYRDCRLDLFVKAMVPSMSRTKIQKYCDAGRVLVNGAPRPANWVARLGDEVVLCCKDPEGGAAAATARAIAATLEALYEDDDVLAVNKPAGLVVHPVGRHRHDTLLNALYERYKDVLPPEQEVSLANRLDQYTSGLILVAKNTAAKRVLQDQFENRRVSKEYYAICAGVIAADGGEVDAPLGPKEPGSTLLQAVRRDALGKPARTEYQVLERFPARDGDKGLTFVRLLPHTGRQHQLRVHMASIGHPLLSDQHYGQPLTLTLEHGGGVATMARYALHAAKLTFRHPDGKLMTLEAPLADDLTAVLAALRAGAPRVYTERPVRD